MVESKSLQQELECPFCQFCFAPSYTMCNVQVKATFFFLIKQILFTRRSLTLLTVLITLTLYLLLTLLILKLTLFMQTLRTIYMLQYS